MSDLTLVYQVLDAQLELATSLDHPEVTECALKIAFYDAILEAQAAEPLADPADNAQFSATVNLLRATVMSQYMQLINEEM